MSWLYEALLHCVVIFDETVTDTVYEIDVNILIIIPRDSFTGWSEPPDLY